MAMGPYVSWEQRHITAQSMLNSIPRHRLLHITILLLWSTGKIIGSEHEAGDRMVQWQRQWVRTSGGLKFKSEKTLWSSGKNNGLKLKLDTSSNLESHCGPVAKTMGQTDLKLVDLTAMWEMGFESRSRLTNHYTSSSVNG
ncbi:uncharacterized protein LOC144070640 [Stigmatopora argus]